MADQELTDLTADANPTTDDLLYVVSDPGGSPVDKKVSLGNLMTLAPHYVDRGDPSAWDFETGDFTTDNTWRDLDLSSIVPAGATTIQFKIMIWHSAANHWMEFRKNGNSNAYNVHEVRTQEAWVYSEKAFRIPCDSNRVIEYRGENITFTGIVAVVQGWTIDAIAAGDLSLVNITDRGDPAAWDWETGDLTKDANYNDLDLSSVVPAGADYVLLRVRAQTGTAGDQVRFRKNGKSNGHADPLIEIQVANRDIDMQILVPCDTGQVIEYKATNTTWTTLGIVVQGWIAGTVQSNRPPRFVDRGDPASYDFELAALTTDGTWRDLDLSSIVPDGAVAVNLSGYIVDDTVSKYLLFRKNGNSNGVNKVGITTQVANVGIDFSVTVSCDSNRVIEYFASNTTWTAIGITVNGWIL